MRVQADGLTFAYGAHEVLRGVKKAFDPLGIMNPGKMFSPLEEE